MRALLIALSAAAACLTACQQAADVPTGEERPAAADTSPEATAFGETGAAEVTAPPRGDAPAPERVPMKGGPANPNPSTPPTLPAEPTTASPMAAPTSSPQP